MSQTARATIRDRGEITIPKKIREAVHLEAGEEVAFIPIGEEAILLTPKRLELEEARRQIQKILKRSRITPAEVLTGLEESRAAVYQIYFAPSRRGQKR